MNEVTVATTIAGLELKTLIGNGGGTVKTVEDLKQILTSEDVGVVEIGSITIKERLGNPGNVYFCRNGTSINSIGLTNGGYSYYRKNLPQMVELAHAKDTKLSLNIAGFTSEEWFRLFALGIDANVDMVVINAGCPNVWDNGKQKRILSYHPDGLFSILQTIDEIVPAGLPVAIKLSPLEPFLMTEIASVIDSYDWLRVVVSCNTFPNVYMENEQGTQAIEFEQGFGGLGGASILPIRRGQVRQLRALLPNHDIIAVGGITSGYDIKPALDDGAKAVQVTTPYFEWTVPQRIFGEFLAQYMDSFESI